MSQNTRAQQSQKTIDTMETEEGAQAGRLEPGADSLYPQKGRYVDE